MKRLIRITLTYALFLATTGCTMVMSTSYVEPVSYPESISIEKSFYVPIGHDGKTRMWPLNKTAPAINSGEIASSVLYEKIRERQTRTIRGVAAETEREALETARQRGLDYVVYPKVNLWVDMFYMACRSEFPDEAEVEVSVYDVKSGKAVTQDRLINKGCPINLLYIPVGATTPESRFRKISNTWVNKRLSLVN